MTQLEQLLNDQQQQIERLANRVEILAEHLASHAAVMHIMARQIKALSNDSGIDIDQPRMQ
jgi:hypothetical protein